MNTSEMLIKRENIFVTFFVGWLAFLSTFKISLKHIIVPVIGQLFGIMLISLAPILEYREMIDVMATADGWIYVALSLSGLVFFIYFLWRFFVTLAASNLLARDIYDNRAIANLSFYKSEILRKKFGYLKFLVGYAFVAIVFTALTAGILFLERNLVVYNFLTSVAGILLLFLQTLVVLCYVLFSNIAIQGYSFNRILGFSRTMRKIVGFIGENFVMLTLLSMLTVAFSNILAYLVQALLSLIVLNPLELYSDSSVTIALRFTVGFIVNAFVVVLMQYIYSRFYLGVQQDSGKMF